MLPDEIRLNPLSALSEESGHEELPCDKAPDAGVTSAVLKPQAARRRKPPHAQGAGKWVTCGECAAEEDISHMI